MLKSNSAKFKNSLVIDIVIEDLYINNHAYEFSRCIEKNRIENVILNLEHLDVITSNDIEKIEEIISVLKLNGVDVIVCGINPYCASVIFSFVNNINFKTELNVKAALNVFSYK